MATMATWFSIPREHIILEANSINTVDEAAAIKQWVHQDPFYLVTSPIHMPRSMGLCRKQGLNPVAAPTENVGDLRMPWLKAIAPNPGNLENINSAWHEILGGIWAAVTGKIQI